MLLEDRSVIEDQMSMFTEDREPTPVVEETPDTMDLDAAVRVINLIRVTMNALRILVIMRHKEDLEKKVDPLLGQEASFKAYMQAFESLDFILSDLLDEAKEVVAKTKALAAK